MFGTKLFRIKARINRNIVECKFVRIKISRYRTIELIETLWNVNKRGNMHLPTSFF